MKRIKSNKDFGCRRIRADADGCVKHSASSGMIPRFLQVPIFLSGRYCLLATAQVLFFADMEPPQLPPKKSNH